MEPDIRANRGLAQEVETMLEGSEAPEKILERVSPLQPFDMAEILVELSLDNQVRLMSLLPTQVSAETLEYLEPDDQYHLLKRMEKAIASDILNQMSSDSVADLMLAVHPNQAKMLLQWLPDEYRRQIDILMTFPEDTAGGLATVDYIAVREGWTVAQTLDHIRKVGHEAEVISYVYVVNAKGQLVDVVSLKEIILAKPDTLLSEIVDNEVISVTADTDQEEAARILAQYDFVALPVVDSQRRMIGIITVDDLVDVIEEEATEDIQRFGGSEPLTESYFRTPTRVLVRKRIGWLLILFVAQAYTGTVLSHFEDALSEAVSLAFFIPLLIGAGGNIGSQTVATLVRSLAVGEVGIHDMFRALLKEMSTGFFLGVAVAGASFVRALTLGVGTDLGRIVAVSAFFIVVWASIVSSILPIILHRLKVDPAVVSGPLITTLVDGTGLFMYFTIARAML